MSAEFLPTRTERGVKRIAEGSKRRAERFD